MTCRLTFHMTAKGLIIIRSAINAGFHAEISEDTSMLNDRPKVLMSKSSL